MEDKTVELQFITHFTDTYSYYDSARMALEGGCRWIQLRHYKAGADYIGCGPFRFTTTKKDLSPVLGLEGYRSIILQMKEANIHLPIVAIGGITLEDIPSIMETGITGIALSGTILRAKDPVAETKRIMNL